MFTVFTRTHFRRRVFGTLFGSLFLVSGLFALIQVSALSGSNLAGHPPLKWLVGSGCFALVSGVMWWGIRRQRSRYPEFLLGEFERVYEQSQVKFMPVLREQDGKARVVAFLENRMDQPTNGVIALEPVETGLEPAYVQFEIGAGELIASAVNLPVPFVVAGGGRGQSYDFSLSAYIWNVPRAGLLRLAEGRWVPLLEQRSLSADVLMAITQVAIGGISPLPAPLVRRVCEPLFVPKGVARFCEPEPRQTLLWSPDDLNDLNDLEKGGQIDFLADF